MLSGRARPQRGDGETRTRTEDTAIFSGGTIDLARRADRSEKARVCRRFMWFPATADGRAACRDTRGYRRIPGGLGRRAGFVGPNLGPPARRWRDTDSSCRHRDLRSLDTVVARRFRTWLGRPNPERLVFTKRPCPAPAWAREASVLAARTLTAPFRPQRA